MLADGEGNDLVDGSSGDDTLVAGEGDDVYAGGSGYDTLDFSNAYLPMVIDVSKKTATGMGADTFSGIEAIVGSGYDDSYKGSSQADVFNAGGGNDVMRSLGGADLLTGGAGNDTFVYFKKDVSDGTTHFGADQITDFAAGDKLDLHDFLKSARFANIAEVVHTDDTAEGTMVSVKMGTGFVNVAMLEDVHGMTANDMLQAGMILT